MGVPITPTQSQVFDLLASFLTGILPPGTQVIRTQVNRVPEPADQDWVAMTPLHLPRLATNVDTYADCTLTGSIAGDVLTVTAVSYGSVVVGAPLYGAAPGTAVVGLCPPSAGGVGSYHVSPPQNLARTTLYAGTASVLQKQEFTVQLDVHGPNSMDNVTRVTTLWRDLYASTYFYGNASFDAQPLYTSDPRQVAFVNGEDQYEDRWTVDVTMQLNPVVTAPQQFFENPKATVESVGTLPT